MGLPQERARDRTRRAEMRTVADQPPDGWWPNGEGQGNLVWADVWADRRYPEGGHSAGTGLWPTHWL